MLLNKGLDQVHHQPKSNLRKITYTGSYKRPFVTFSAGKLQLCVWTLADLERKGRLACRRSWLWPDDPCVWYLLNEQAMMKLIFGQGFCMHHAGPQVWQRSSLLHPVLHSVVWEPCVVQPGYPPSGFQL